MKNHSNLNLLIVVPAALKEQWKSELLLKFNIDLGTGENNNTVVLKSFDELNRGDLTKRWDFLVVDEIHRYLHNRSQYDQIHTISSYSKNVLMLSATPVQQRKEEYLNLLRLLLPEKYDKYNLTQFGSLVDKQGMIIQKTALVLDNLEDLQEAIADSEDSEEDPHESEDCEDLFEEIKDGLDEICVAVNDSRLDDLLHRIRFEKDDLGVYDIKIMIAFICGNYQIESNIIRNRRRILEISEDGNRLMPIREFQFVEYELNEDLNTFETMCYQILSDWITDHSEIEDLEEEILPLLGALFSSPWAFNSYLKKCGAIDQSTKLSLIENADRWVGFENTVIGHIREVLDNPALYEDEFSTRIMSVMNLLYDDLYDKKVVLFTNYEETFEIYKKVLQKSFADTEVSFFGASMPTEEIELGAYRFQNDSSCRIMLCDYTGGEGRNFQCADYIVHIDLPWDANSIEQRIGRLDRLERDPARPVVHSIVVYSKDTFENALFDFWNKGLNIFNQSLSGMEIIMKEINNQIIDAIRSDFKYGLFDKIPQIVEMAKKMREVVRKERNFDAAGFMYRPMFNDLKRLIDYYAQHENELFASTMQSWASLAGFHGYGRKDGTISFSATSFSPKSAVKSQLIPPKWTEYLNTTQNRFINKVQDAYNRKNAIKTHERTIQGTFIRKKAIENDYLHFFAPGDDVFDCIVDNAMNSCKGKAAAFAVKARINWCGLIFTWTWKPNETYLLDQDISIYALNSYRNYLNTDQIVIPISIRNIDSVSNDMIVREYSRIINTGYQKSGTIHIGKRDSKPLYLKGIIDGPSNIAWFKSRFAEENWIELINSAKKESLTAAKKRISQRTRLKDIKDEMERILSARAANSEYYGIDDEKIDTIKREQALIIEAIRHPVVSLESAAFIWMVKTNHE